MAPYGKLETPQEAAQGEPIDVWEPYDPAAHHPNSPYHDPDWRAFLRETKTHHQCGSCKVYYGGPHRGHNPGRKMATPAFSEEEYHGPPLTTELEGISHGQCPGCYTEQRRAVDEGTPRGSVIIG